MKVKKSKLKATARPKPYKRVIDIVYKCDTKQLKEAIVLAAKLEAILNRLKK